MNPEYLKGLLSQAVDLSRLDYAVEILRRVFESKSTPVDKQSLLKIIHEIEGMIDKASKGGDK